MREALKDFNRVIELDPNNYQSLSFRGQVRMQLADFEGAVSDLGRVMALRPDNGGVYASRGVALASLGRYRAAEDDFIKAEAIFRKVGDSANLERLFKAQSAIKGIENN
jgi:Flp pilus assembly protein TadD